jgi:guanylate kinase
MAAQVATTETKSVPGLLLVISGPSGTGKGTICQALISQQNQVRYSVSATTRPPRVGEVDGVHYYFKTQEQFQGMIDRDELIEWAKVYDNYYGTPKGPVMQSLELGQDTMLEIDVQGAFQVKGKYPEGIYVFIAPPSLAELRKRIEGRATDAPEVIAKRMEAANWELEQADKYDYVIINDSVQEATAKLAAILKKEKEKRIKNKD